MLPLTRAGQKVFAFAFDRHHRTARIGHKVNAWLGFLSATGNLTPIAPSDDLDRCLEQLLSMSADCFAGRLKVIEDELQASWSKIQEDVFLQNALHNGTTLGRLCYVACRALRPRFVVETGVAYGVTSAYILHALAENGDGKRCSLDLPPLGLGTGKSVGMLIPPHLRGCWDLRVGPARPLLRQVLEESGSVDMFVHDSLHTYSHMKWEFETVLRRLRPDGVLISDDIDGNRAFEEIARRPEVATSFFIRQQDKESICGALRTKRSA